MPSAIILNCLLAYMSLIHGFNHLKLLRSWKRNFASTKELECQLQIRINKCIKKLSRRATDGAILSGRVTVNDRIATIGQMIGVNDVIKLDNEVQNISDSFETKDDIYIKYWKAKGLTCTSSSSDASSIFNHGVFNRLRKRVFTVGRLDKLTTGLLLLTSDGNLTNTLITPKYDKSKTYIAILNHIPSNDVIDTLRGGVDISSDIHRDSWASPITITTKTKPCTILRYEEWIREYEAKDSITPHQTTSISTSAGGSDVKGWEIGVQTDEGVEKQVDEQGHEQGLGGTRTFEVGPSQVPYTLVVTLKEGRNKQIHRMIESVNLRVVSLHRIEFAGISLSGLSGEGAWARLTDEELSMLKSMK